MSNKQLDEMLSSVSEGSNKSLNEQMKKVENSLKRLEKSASLSRVNTLKSKAEDGDTDAMIELGELFLDGIYVKADDNQAFNYFLKAAKLGDIAGQAYTAYCMVFGIGTTAQPKTGMVMLASLCSENEPTAYDLMGRMYVKKNEYDRAVTCFKRARKLNNTAKINYNLATALYLQESFEEAIEIYKLANEMDSKMGGFEIAMCVLNGTGAEKDSVKAIELFKEAIKNGDNVGKSNVMLGQIYLNGDGVEKDFSIAEKYIWEGLNHTDSQKSAQALMREMLKQQREIEAEKKSSEDDEKKQTSSSGAKKLKKFSWIYLVVGLIAVVAVCILIIVVPKLNSGENSGTNNSTSEATSQVVGKTDNKEEWLKAIYDTYKVDDDKLANCFANALVSVSEGSVPVGVSKNDMEPKFNRYAVCDINDDSNEELILIYDDADSLYMSEYICYFDENNSRIQIMLSSVPYLEMYSKGIIKSYVVANVPLSNDFKPYQIYKLEKEKAEYKYYGYVEAWDKNVSVEDSKGESFPEDIDADEDGIVYIVYDKEYKRTVMDGNEFTKFSNDLIGNDKPIDVLYSDLK